MIKRDQISKLNDLDIDRIIITNDFGLEADITEFITSLGFYESIFTPFIVGDMTLQDMQDIMTNLSIVGREKITVSFSTPGIDPEIRTVNFRVIGQKSKIQPNKSRGYILNLRLVSENYFKNQTTRDSVSIKGKPEVIVQKIKEEYLSPDISLAFDETNDEEYSLVFPFQSPLEMIQKVMVNATPSDSTVPEFDAGFLFYETIDGLNFKCFNNLFKQEPSYVFFNSDTIGADPKTDEFTQGTFITEKVVFRDSSNRVKQYENGAFSSRTYFHDLTTKQWGARNFSYINENLVNEKSGNPNTLNTNLNAPLARAIATAQNIDNTMFPVVSQNQVENYSPQKIFFAPRHTNVQGEDFGTNENNYETLPRVKSNMSLYNDTEVEITVSGNSLLRAGQVVTFMVARNEPVDKIKSSASEFNEEKSGKYVISSVHHRFFLQDGSYKTYLNLVRNFRGSIVPSQQNPVNSEEAT